MQASEGQVTALKEFRRLEATGLYSAAPDTQRRDVILSVGAAALTISDQRGAALTHWSLAAIERLNPGRRPAVYAPGSDAQERLEVSDDTMIRAIERVRSAVEKGRPHPGRLRTRLVIASVVVGLTVAVLWLPGALTRTTARLLPDAARSAIGAELLTEIERVAGQPCAAPAGNAALAQLAKRLAPEGPGAALVLPGGPATTAHLPGGTVLLNRSIVEDHETPEVAAGYLLAEAARAAAGDPMLALLGDVGLPATLRLATTGRLPAPAVRTYAETLLTADPADLATGALAARFERAQVPLAPYAYALDVTGETTLGLIEADPVGPGTAPVLADEAWVALQEICG